MRKQIKILMLAIIFILVSAVGVNAADATVTLKPSKTQLHAGDTFTVTMNVACEEGINGLEGTVSYDQDKLELVSLDVTNTNKWVNLGQNLELAVIHNSGDKETSADIVKVTLKVKDRAELGTAKVTISDIAIDSDAASNSMNEVGTKEVEVIIIEDTVNDGQDNNNNTPGSGNTGENNNGTDNKGENVTDKDNTKDEYEEIKKDDTKSENKIPNTGLFSVVGMITIVSVMGVIFFIKYNKYKQI